ncbi:hypothetical protein ACFL4W_04945 [Planctomycetota bacterium]
MIEPLIDEIRKNKPVFGLIALLAFLVVSGLLYWVISSNRAKEEIERERQNEIGQIEEIGKKNKVLKEDILVLIDQKKINEAKDKKRKIENGIEMVSFIIANSKVGTEDIDNIVRIWTLELEDINRIINEAEAEEKWDT